MEEKENEQILMSEQEVFDVFKFADYISDPRYGLNVYTPDIVNQFLKQINVNTIEPTENALNKALGNPNTSENELVGYSEFYNVNNMTYKRMNDYLANMLSFDLKVTCRNAKGKEYNSKEYKEDLDRIYKFLDNLNYKREFRKIVKNMLRQETVFTSFRDDTLDYAIQQIPAHRCKITGSTPYTFLFDIDMYMFLQPGCDINNWHPAFKRYYLDVFNDSTIDNYIPSNPLNARTGEFAMWHQTSPLNEDGGCWVFKFSPEIFTKIPYLSPMMKDIQNSGILRKLQMNKNLAGARALVMGEIGFLDPKSGSKADQLNLTPKTLATFIQLVKAALEEAWTIGGAPLKNLQKFQYEDYNKDMYANQLASTAGQGVSLSRVIYSTDKMSNAEVEVALNTDANLMKSIYRQFEDYLYFFANRKSRKYKFDFSFEGIEYPSDRDARLDRVMQLADKGIVLKQEIGAALGCTPQEFDRMLDESCNGGFTKNLTNLVSIYTQSSGGTSERGRPRKKGILQSSSRDYDDTNE